jgi:hypothetical protein
MPTELMGPLRGKIKLAAARVFGHGQVAACKRWHPRTAFVRPARVYGKSEGGVDVVTIDFSFVGAGILVDAVHDPLPDRLMLVIDGTVFDCEVRWSKKLNSASTRYGLRFCDALDGDSSTIPA